MRTILIVVAVLALAIAGCTAVVTYNSGENCTVTVTPNQPFDVGVQINPSPTTQPKE